MSNSSMKGYGDIPNQPSKQIRVIRNFFDAGDLQGVAFSGLNKTTPTVVQDAFGGGVLLTNAGADNDACLMAGDAEVIRLNKKNAIYEVEFLVVFNEATENDVFMGLVAGAYTIASPTNDFIGLIKNDGETVYSLKSYKNGAGTTDTLGSPTFTAAEARYKIRIRTSNTLGIATSVEVFKNGEKIATVRNVTIADDEEMKWMIGVQNGEGAAKTATVKQVSYAFPTPFSV